MPEHATRDEVRAFRLHAHHLTRRLPPGAGTGPAEGPGDALVAAAGTCGIQNSPPGSALLALHARVRGVSAAALDEAVAGSKALVQSWCMRGAPFFFPASDAAVFTTGALPEGEAALRHFLPGLCPPLDSLGLSITAAARLAGEQLPAVLAGRRLAIGELGAELAARIAATLTPAQLAIWCSPGPWAPGQAVGEGVTHFLLRIATLQQVVCLAPRAGGKAPFVLVSEWLPGSRRGSDPRAARAGLARRFLHSYGPATPAQLATWLGVTPVDAGAWWDLLDGELTETTYAGRSWLLAADLEALRAAPAPQGLRLLPPRDPYTQGPDKDALAPAARHREVWRPQGEPGTVLVDGVIAGTWRPRKAGRTLTLTISPWRPMTAGTLALLDHEAQRIAALRGAARAAVVTPG